MSKGTHALSCCLVFLVCPGSVAAQVVSQSDLGSGAIDATFRLTLEHLAQDPRWLGLAPRDAVWAPDSRSLFFRWRHDPAPGQHPSTDPWYEVARNGREVRIVPETDTWRIPTNNASWAVDRRRAAWARDGRLVVWDPGRGTRTVYRHAGALGQVAVTPRGDRVYFATTGLDFTGTESADLWAYHVEREQVRQVAAVVTRPDDPRRRSDAARWLQE